MHWVSYTKHRNKIEFELWLLFVFVCECDSVSVSVSERITIWLVVSLPHTMQMVIQSADEMSYLINNILTPSHLICAALLHTAVSYSNSSLPHPLSLELQSENINRDTYINNFILTLIVFYNRLGDIMKGRKSFHNGFFIVIITATGFTSVQQTFYQHIIWSGEVKHSGTLGNLIM